MIMTFGAVSSSVFQSGRTRSFFLARASTFSSQTILTSVRLPDSWRKKYVSIIKSGGCIYVTHVQFKVALLLIEWERAEVHLAGHADLVAAFVGQHARGLISVVENHHNEAEMANKTSWIL